MAKDFVKTWDGRRLEDWGSSVSKEYKSFQQAMRREVKRLAENEGATLVSYNSGHYYQSGFVEKDGLYVYFCYEALDRCHVQLTDGSAFFMRTASGPKDYHGGSNNNVTFSQFSETMRRLFRQQERERMAAETTEDNNSSTNNQNSEDKVMTNETMKVADLIGKSISNGGNAKYTINGIEGDKVKVTFQMGDSEGKPMTMGVAQVEKLLQGGWTVSDGTQEPTEKKADGGSQKAEEPKAKTVKMTSEREQSGTRSGSAERESSRPQGKMEPEPKPKAEKPKVTLKRKQPQTEAKAEEPKQEHKAGKLVYSAYTNAKGKTCAKVSGFAETDAAYQKEAAASLHGSATYENTKQGRVNFLLFGPRYAEVAKTVCQMLNEGKTVADCQAVVDAATEERAQKREEWKQKRAAYRQEHEGKAQTAKPQGEKLYTAKEIADLMERVMRGDADALAEVNAIKAKAA